MAQVLQLRRGTTAQNDAFTGAIAEVSVDTDRDSLRVHDGTTMGGKEIAPLQVAVPLLPAASSVSGSDEVPVIQGGVARRATKTQILNGIVNSNISASAAIAGTKIAPDFGSQNVTTTGTLSANAGSVISGSSNSAAALRITQTGTGDALLVEDDTNPDATPLVINNVGQIISGATTAIDAVAGLQLTSDSASAPNGSIILRRNSNDTNPSVITFQKARGTLASPSVVSSGDVAGSVNFGAYDGASIRNFAGMNAVVDGTPTSSPVSMPGYLRFNTRSAADPSQVERMRIDSAGNVGIGTTSPTTKLDVNGTITATTVIGSLKLATAVATTSGTSIDFTGIPSWAKRITIMLNKVSTSGTSVVQVQVGNTSFVTSGYETSAGVIFGANTCHNSTISSGFGTYLNAAVDQRTGSIVLNNISGNTWVCMGVLVAPVTYLAGSVALSGALDRIRLTTVNGTDTFDAGSVNIMYEG